MIRHGYVKLLSLALPLLFIFGCGIPEEQHNAVKKDLENTKMALAEEEQTTAQLRSDIEKLDAKIAELESEKAELEQNLSETEAALEVFESEHGSMEERLQATKSELAELRTARAEAEKRLERYREIAQKLATMVESGQLAVKIRDGKMVIELANNILFDSGSTRIKDDGEAALADLAGVLQEIDKRDFLVAGHTDDVGKAEANWALSTKRAVEVVQFLQDNGVEPSNLAAAGYGEYDPVASNENDEGKALNRRIEIIMMPNLDELPNIPTDVIEGS